MTKHCPQCGRELPPESNFCPYCMTKLTQEEKFENTPPPKPKRKKWFFLAGIVIVVVAVLAVLWAAFGKRATKVSSTASAISSASSTAVSKPVSSASKTSSVISAINYGSYVGKWYDEESQNKTDIMTQGGNCLQIISASGSQLVFSLTEVTEPPANRIAKIDNVIGTVSGDSVTFAFSDDGWGNGGKGTLTLKNGEIYAKVKITEPDSSAQMNLAMQCYFKKVAEASSEEAAPVELSQILGADFANVRGQLGEETKKSYLDDGTDDEVHTFGAVQVYVDDASETVASFEVDFTASGAQKKYTFDDFDGTVTYNQIIKKYGTSKDISSSNGEKTVGYDFKQKPGHYVKYTFSSSGHLKDIMCFESHGADTD